jgi:DNA-directed RNA polymerase subunit beta'
VSEVAGRIQFAGLEDGITVKRQTDELTGLTTIEILDLKDRPQAGKDIRPMIKLVTESGEDVFHPVPRCRHSICCRLSLL